MFVLNGKTLTIGSSFVHNGVQYPGNWLRQSSAEEKAAIGITEVPDAVTYDDRFYWGPGIPKNVLGLRARFIEEIDVSVWNMLKMTDYMESRSAIDMAYSPPREWMEWRASVRAIAATAKAALSVAMTVEAIIPLAYPVFPVLDAQTIQTLNQDLNHLKESKKYEINAARLAANHESFVHDGITFSRDVISRGDIETTNSEIVNLGTMPAGWLGFWKAEDNSLYPINTVAEWKAFHSSVFNTGNANFMKAQMLKAQVDAAQSPEAVAQIVW